MALKDLTVHLDRGERTRVRLALAVSLARDHQASLTGLFAQRAPAQHVGVVAAWPTQEYTDAAEASPAAARAAPSALTNPDDSSHIAPPMGHRRPELGRRSVGPVFHRREAETAGRPT